MHVMGTLFVVGTTIGARELRLRIAEILRAVEDGDTVTVTRHGHPIAEIRPVQRHRKSAEDDVFGMWKDREDMKDARAWVRELRRSRVERMREK